MMTQEEMCVLIQTGERQDLVPVLWERVQKLYSKRVYSYYSSHRERCAACGVELEDMQQQAFFAFIEAIEAYDPERGLTFSAFINYPFLKYMQELLCYRVHSRADILNMCDSLDKELDIDGDGGSTLHELIADPHSTAFIEQLDGESVAAMIRAEVATLPERERRVIEGNFFEGLTLAEIGEQIGVSRTRAAQIKNNALKQLAKRRNLAELHRAFYHSAELRRLELASRHSFEADRRYNEVLANLEEMEAERQAFVQMILAGRAQSSTV